MKPFRYYILVLRWILRDPWLPEENAALRKELETIKNDLLEKGGAQ